MMKKCKAILLAVLMLLPIVALVGCSSGNDYSVGYDNGYQAGYNAGYSDAQDGKTNNDSNYSNGSSNADNNSNSGSSNNSTQSLGFGDSAILEYSSFDKTFKLKVTAADTFEIFSYSGYYNFGTVTKKLFVRIPVTIENLGDATGSITSNMINYFDSEGKGGVDGFDYSVLAPTPFEDGSLSIEIRPGRSYEAAVYIPYTGAGIYELVLDSQNIGSTEIAFQFDIPEYVG